MVAKDFFTASKFYDFFNQYCSNLLKNPTVRGLNTAYFCSQSLGINGNSVNSNARVHASLKPLRV